MPFDRPTLAVLMARIQSDFVSRLSLESAPLRRSVVAVTARVLAGAVHMLHGHLEFLGRQLFPDASESEFLERYASLVGYTRSPATYATGSITITGVNGSVIPAGTLLRRTDGVVFETDAEGTISGGDVDVDVTAVLAGEDGNTDAGVTLTFESPIVDVDAEAEVGAGGLTEGADTETDAALRTRVLARLRNPPQGGAEADYEVWALEVPGVTRAWVYPQENGAGTVNVRFVRDNDVSLIPSAGEVTEVQDYIDARRPVTATVTVSAPTAAPIAFTIDLTPDTAATRAAVTAELTDMLRTYAEPGSTVLLSRIRTAIGIAEGVTNYILTVPAADVTHTAGQLATLGTITWL